MIAAITRLLFLSVSLSAVSVFTQAYERSTPVQAQEPQSIMLSCHHCQQTQASTRLYLEQTIYNVTFNDRLVFIKTNKFYFGSPQPGGALYFVYFIRAGDNSRQAKFHGTSSVSCPRCQID